MNKLSSIFVFFAILAISIGSDAQQMPRRDEFTTVWGDLSANVILGSSKTKYGVPFITRVEEFAYPGDFQASSAEPDRVVIRGIKHTNNLREVSCHQVIDIIKGGINEKFAVVRVTSGRGCGINSLVEFFIEKF